MWTLNWCYQHIVCWNGTSVIYNIYWSSSVLNVDHVRIGIAIRLQQQPLCWSVQLHFDCFKYSSIQWSISDTRINQFNYSGQVLGRTSEVRSWLGRENIHAGHNISIFGTRGTPSSSCQIVHQIPSPRTGTVMNNKDTRAKTRATWVVLDI